ncbi:hypothetical protein PGB34_21965 [Xenophilus arseniciresistens]|uniref:Uncharacterized protein n=1 Tax=Xenophilus arseniciresistens TaxID=1283306 RepID=A0AAE3T2G8_9BURK|nr:hypothetical protein [Xenophilus arseniciresistens]MDA7419046.1 hypothetical protein [Xenophilus arseniciresistens]
MDTLLGSAIDVLLTITGRFAVWLFSLGRWRSESLDGEEGRIYGAAGALSFVREGHRVITTTGQLFAGIAFYVFLAVMGVLYAVAV